MQRDEGAGDSGASRGTGELRAGSAEPRPGAVPVRSESYPKASRIRARPEFLRVQSEGLRVGTAHLLLIALPRSSEELPTRLGVVASRKVGGSVVRSRAKRLVREVFRRSRELFPKATDVVVIARPGLDALGFEGVRREIASVSERLRRRLRERRPGGPPGGTDEKLPRRPPGSRAEGGEAKRAEGREG